jgi:hypothetical protein
MDPYYLYDFVQSIQSYGFGTEIKAFFGTIFEVLFVVSMPYRIVCTFDYGHRK